MRLLDLDPRPFVSPYPGGPATVPELLAARKGMGISIRCPCRCGSRDTIAFANPLDGGVPASGFAAYLTAESPDDQWDTLTIQEPIAGQHGRWRLRAGLVEAA